MTMPRQYLMLAVLGCVWLCLGPARVWAHAPDPDLNNDGVVNILDVSMVSSCWGQDPAMHPPCHAADTDGDGDVDMADLLS